MPNLTEITILGLTGALVLNGVAIGRAQKSAPGANLALEFACSGRRALEILRRGNEKDRASVRDAIRQVQYWDFVFIGLYAALFLLIAWNMAKEETLLGPMGILALTAALAAGVLDLLEDLAILRVLKIPEDQLTASQVGIGRDGVAKWKVIAAVCALEGFFFFFGTSITQPCYFWYTYGLLLWIFGAYALWLAATARC